MHLSPRLYHRFVRPQWFTKKYIHDHIKSRFTLENKIILDFGCGTGANCCMSGADHYYGIDPDVKRIQFAKQLYPNHTFMVFDGKQLPMPDRTVDLILIVAVLHHISNEHITEYLHEFHRVLKPDGYMIVIEPYLCRENKINNWFMSRYDNGKYIRNEHGYLQIFKNQRFDCQVLKKFTKCLLYNEIFFTATPNGNSAQIYNYFSIPSGRTGEEVIDVTVASQVKTCVASLKSAQASLEQFALETKNQGAKSLFTNASEQTKQIVQQMESRVQQIENEEPQYKGF